MNGETGVGGIYNSPNSTVGTLRSAETRGLLKPDQPPSHNASCTSLHGTAWLTVIVSRSPRSSALLIAGS